MEGLAARVVTVAVPRADLPAMAARVAMGEMAVQVLLEQISVRMALPGRLAELAELVVMAVALPQASRAMAAREAMAVSPEPGALVSARSLRAKMAGMVATAGMVALLEPGERAAPPAMR